ncbi:MAG: RES family NAD+ phosphorylase [Gemmatimonadetes bacterium]|nr:RES family NAD+ phosphorylase [Gemmatimonadota bacterium]
MTIPAELWRAFPCDPAAAPGAPFSPTYVPVAQGSGRFDLGDVPVLYTAELPEHAVAEKIARFRGSVLRDYHLEEFGRRLALVSLAVPRERAADILDLCDPAVLARHSMRPDHVAARDVRVSQAVARSVYEAGFSGLRSWSSSFGEWHAVVLFLDRIPMERLSFAAPVPLTTRSPEVVAGAGALAMKVG